MILSRFSDWRRLVLGPPRNPLQPDIRRHIALVAFLAWVGLGADGLSSANYGPEQGFLALGEHGNFALYLAVATGITVFIIAHGYNQVIELFPTGGGGYKVATQILGAKTGLVSGAALVIDYVLTVTISVASGADALFSLLPLAAQPYKVWAAAAAIVGLGVMNLRGVKESISILMPVFLLFFISHAYLILHGTIAHADRLPTLVIETVSETFSFAAQVGWMQVLAILLLAFSLGGGTYTGIEAVSNNINQLAEPRVRTGKLTMFYMASSLAFTASGIILLYLIWNVAPEEGQTLNAVAFRAIMSTWTIGGFELGDPLLVIVLASEAGLLLVAANAGFLGGPAVLANLASDGWMPHQFSYLSSRLVTENGILLMAVAAIALLLVTAGRVDILVVLYSINVFITFTLSLLGMCVYWVKQRPPRWPQRLMLAFTGFVLCAGILVVTSFEKFADGGWITILSTGLLIGICLLIRRHYEETRRQIDTIDKVFTTKRFSPVANPPALSAEAPTAALLVSGRGTGMHSLLWIQRLFPNHFRNFVFITVRAVDSQSFGGAAALKRIEKDVEVTLKFFVNYCHAHKLAATSYRSFGVDAVAVLEDVCDKTSADFPNAVFFASKLIFERDSWWKRLLHNQTAYAIQRRLHLKGRQMVVLPMKLD